MRFSYPGVISEQYLDPAEWWFEDVDNEQLTACFLWEYCREDPELRVLPVIGASKTRVLDLRSIFLQHLDVHRRLTNVDGQPEAWQKLKPLSLRDEIARDFKTLFRAVDVVSQEDAAIPPRADYFKMITLLIDWRHSDEAIESAFKRLVPRPAKYEEKIRATEGEMRALDPLAPSELSALRYLGMLRCRRRGGKDGQQCRIKEVARIYTKKKASQVSREVKFAGLVLDWFRTGKRSYLRELKRIRP